MTDLSIGPATPGQAAYAVQQAQAREQWQAAIEKELRARGMTFQEAAEAFQARSIDFERCRRNSHTAAHAVTSVIGNWAAKGEPA